MLCATWSVFIDRTNTRADEGTYQAIVKLCVSDAASCLDVSIASPLPGSTTTAISANLLLAPPSTQASMSAGLSAMALGAIRVLGRVRLSFPMRHPVPVAVPHRDQHPVPPRVLIDRHHQFLRPTLPLALHPVRWVHAVVRPVPTLQLLLTLLTHRYYSALPIPTGLVPNRRRVV